MPDPDALHSVLTLLVVLAAVYAFARERLPPDLTALLALLALLVGGVLDPREAFAGFSHPATVSVAAVLVLSEGLRRTGAITFVARRLLLPIARLEWLLAAVTMLVGGTLSAFINNTAVVAVFIPVALELGRAARAHPARLLMPLSHAATLGGTCTLVGTSTNLVAHELASQRGLPGYTMFELGAIGIPAFLAGFAWLFLIGRHLLPKSGLAPPGDPATPCVAELVVPAGSPWCGRTLQPAEVRRDLGLDVLAATRGERRLATAPEPPRLERGDRLRVRGPLERLLAVERTGALVLHRPERARAEDDTPAEGTQASRSILEVVVLPGSHLIGRTLKEVRFAEAHGAIVLALRRRDVLSLDRPSTTPIRAGDVLVLEGGGETGAALRAERGFLVLGERAEPEQARPQKLGIAVLTIAAVVATTALGLLPIVTAATAGCAVLVLTGCLKPREAYAAIDWSIVIVLGGMLALATALERTGLAAALARGVEVATDDLGPRAALAALLILAAVTSELMSNSGTMALLGPVALATAERMGLNPMAALVAVNFGAMSAFAMPFGYQTSLMIYGPGGYRFRDFVRVGLPLDLILGALALWLIPRFWPLAAASP